MEKQNTAAAVKDNDVVFNTNDLDDIISSDEVLENFNQKYNSKMVTAEKEVDVIKEEPVLSYLEDESLSDDINSLDVNNTAMNEDSDSFDLEDGATSLDSEPVSKETGKTVIGEDDNPANKGEVLFSDESEEVILPDENEIIIEDKETASRVKEEVKKETILYSTPDAPQSKSAHVERKSTEVVSESEQSFFENDDDESISLSSDELSNILEDAEETELAEVPTVDSVLEIKEQNIEEPMASEEISLSDVPDYEPSASGIEEQPVSLDEEGPVIQSGIEEEPVSLEAQQDITEISEEQPVTLSGDDTLLNELEGQPVSLEDESPLLGNMGDVNELDTIDQAEEHPAALTAEEIDLAEASNEMEKFEAEPAVLRSETSFGEDISSASDLDQPVPLSDSDIFSEEEVNHIQETEQAKAELDELEEQGKVDASSSFFDSVDDESISLTGSELDNIIQTSDIIEEPESSGPTSSEKGLMDHDLDSEMPMPGVKSASRDIDPEKLKKILQYLDDLLESLPENKIKEFAESQYYDMYNELLGQLGL